MDCVDTEACYKSFCLDPCEFTNACASTAKCHAKAHRPICTCPSGYEGNPAVKCSPTQPCKIMWIIHVLMLLSGIAVQLNFLYLFLSFQAECVIVLIFHGSFSVRYTFLKIGWTKGQSVTRFKNMWIIIVHGSSHLAGKCSGSTLDLYLGGALSESWFWHWLSWLRFCVVFFNSSWKNARMVLQLGHDYFLSSHHPSFALPFDAVQSGCWQDHKINNSTSNSSQLHVLYSIKMIQEFCLIHEDRILLWKSVFQDRHVQ